MKPRVKDWPHGEPTQTRALTNINYMEANLQEHRASFSEADLYLHTLHSTRLNNCDSRPVIKRSSLSQPARNKRKGELNATQKEQHHTAVWGRTRPSKRSTLFCVYSWASEWSALLIYRSHYAQSSMYMARFVLPDVTVRLLGNPMHEVKKQLR